MVSLKDCPHDVLHLIFEEACSVDAGVTARVLSLVSRRISAIASAFLYRNISLSGISHIESARSHLLTIPLERRPTCNLFLADLPSDYIFPAPDSPDSPTGQTSPKFKIRGSWNAAQARAFTAAVDALLELLAPTLQTLACVTRNPWQPFLLVDSGRMPFPRLTNLLLCQNTRIPFAHDTPPLSPLSPSPLCSSSSPPPQRVTMPQLRQLHLSYCGTGYAGFGVEQVVRLFAHGCPRLEQLCLSDVDFYFGGQEALGYMLSEIFRDDVCTEDRSEGMPLPEYPSGLHRVVVQLAKRWRPELEEADMLSLQGIQKVHNVERFTLEIPQATRTFDDWTGQWLEASKGGHDTWVA